MYKPRLKFVWMALISLPLLGFSAGAQQLIGSVNVGYDPSGIAVNPLTHKVYVANQCATDNCSDGGSITVIDETTLGTTTVQTAPQYGEYSTPIAINKTTNKIYVVTCGTTNCFPGVVQEIDGVTLASRLVQVGNLPSAIVINENTNKIYVLNSCTGCNGTDTLTVIDGSTLNTTTIDLGQYNYYYIPGNAAINPNTNKIYVTNSCGSDMDCTSPGSLSVIDGATLGITTIAVPRYPALIEVDQTRNKIYVGGGNAVTQIDGGTLASSSALLQTTPVALAVDQTTNRIFTVGGESGSYRGQLSATDGRTLATTFTNLVDGPSSLALNTTTGKLYTTFPAYYDLLGSIDGNDLSMFNMTVGGGPVDVAVDETNNRTYVINECGNYYGFCFGVQGTVSVIDETPPTAWQFVPVTPCRVVDTRNPDGPFGGPAIPGGSFRSFAIPQGSCEIPPSAAAYALNVTVAPHGALRYLTIWPTGQPQPTVSTMNSMDGRIKANAAVVAGGTSEAVSVYASDTTDVILDINGYFVPLPSQNALAFYPLTPCRVVDTRGAEGPLGGPYLQGNQERDFPILQATGCNIPSSAQAYSLNFTALPKSILGYLTAWPAGDQQPGVSTLNDATGTVVANAALLPSGSGGDIDVYVTNDTDLLIDINGYFAPAGQGGLSLYAPTVCRLLDTRQIGPPVDGERTVAVATTGCIVPSTAQAYVLNATVLPQGYLGYLTLWPDTEPQPSVSTLNAHDGAVTSNMAIVPTVNGSIDAYAPNWTQLILDISGYFAP